MNKQKLALFIALIVLVLSVIWSVIFFPRQKTVSNSKSGPVQATQVRKPTVVSAAKRAETTTLIPVKPQVAVDERSLRLDLLEREQTGFKGYRRNIFKPIFADEIKLMKQRSAAFKPLPLPPVAVVVPKPVVVVPAVPPGVQQETHQSVLAKFTFLGFLKKDNRKTIFLMNDKEIVLVRKGETFAKRYEATVLTDQALTIRVIETGEQIVIPLTENKPLVAASKK